MALRLLIERARQVTQVTTRYGSGGPGKNVCKGQCEGMGVVPVKADTKDPRFKKLWLAAEKKKPSDDGYHFVKCPDCGGTGKAPSH